MEACQSCYIQVFRGLDLPGAVKQAAGQNVEDHMPGSQLWGLEGREKDKRLGMPLLMLYIWDSHDKPKIMQYSPLASNLIYLCKAD